MGYVKSSRDEEEAELAEATAAHAEEGRKAPPSPRGSSRRSFGARPGRPAGRHGKVTDRPDRSEEGGSRRQPSPGHGAGVPPFPGPLPGSHHYREHETAAGHDMLDVGPAKPYYSGGMAHGVETDVHHGGRPSPKPGERTELEATRADTAREMGSPPDPVPVYIVKKGAGARPLTRAALLRRTVPAVGGDPFILVPKDPHRRTVQLLNESANKVRLTYDPTAQPAAAPGTGALLPASMTSYLTIETQDEIWAWNEPGSSGTADVSVITSYDIPAGA
jgi:hypothetical protein